METPRSCLHCQRPLPEPMGRFCDGCGLANPHYRAPAKKVIAPEPSLIRCPECGLPASSRRCRGCSALVRWPEGLAPPDE
jgi:hypothetical protein